MSPDQPRLTIVTPSKNGARYLVEAIESVRRQRYPNLEHIVVDACSTDGTLELLARYPD
ncbi:MAG: glycosyltransferase, partial [Xanthobacteraceae bacterium]|nr:glycosyltransferase [Xanthobacteraceae bacterium]